MRDDGYDQVTAHSDLHRPGFIHYGIAMTHHALNRPDPEESLTPVEVHASHFVPTQRFGRHAADEAVRGFDHDNGEGPA